MTPSRKKISQVSDLGTHRADRALSILRALAEEDYARLAASGLALSPTQSGGARLLLPIPGGRKKTKATELADRVLAIGETLGIPIDPEKAHGLSIAALQSASEAPKH